MSVPPADPDVAPSPLGPLVQALFGARGHRLLRGDVEVHGEPFEGPHRDVELLPPYVLQVPAESASGPEVEALRALLGTCLDDAVLLTLDPDGRCVRAAGRVKDMLGVPPHHLEDAPIDGWLRRVHPIDQGPLRVAVETGAQAQRVVRYRGEDSRMRHLEVRLEPVQAGGLRVRFRDVTEVSAARMELASLRRRERALVGAQPDAMLRVRGDGRIVELLEGRAGLPEGLTAMSVGGRLSDALSKPHGTELERMVATVVRSGSGGVLRLQLGETWWEARAEPADDGQALLLVRDITEREHLLREVVDARERAETASREKSRFLANMSHEIRTPLNGVLGMADLLLHTPLDLDQTDLAQSIRSSGRLLLSLLNDLLDFSKIEAGELQLESVRFDLVGTFEEAVELAAPAAQAKGLELVLDVDPDLPAVAVGDPKRLRQILVNLVSNAVKFTSDGHVLVRVAPYGDSRIRVDVEDTGIGIAQETVARLFDPFAQGDVSMARRFGGTGLGLAICKELVERMEGRISVESTLGQGSTFSFDLRVRMEEGRRRDDEPRDLAGARVALVRVRPVQRRALARVLEAWGLQVVDGDTAAVDVRIAGEGVEGIAEPCIRIVSWGESRPELGVRAPVRRRALLRALRDSLGLISQRDEVASAGPPPLVGRVLVVEDNPVNQRITRGQLERLGLTVLVAENGAVGLRRVQQHDVDLVLLDLHMPDMDGIEVSRLIRQRGLCMPIVALTAGLVEDRQRCMDAGMDGFLSKPVEPGQLRSLLSRWLGTSASERRSA